MFTITNLGRALQVANIKHFHNILLVLTIIHANPKCSEMAAILLVLEKEIKNSYSKSLLKILRASNT